MTVEVAYWPIRGLANPIRFLLEYVDADYKETRHDKQEWPNVKFELGLDFPNLPYLIDDKVKLSQSGAILRYLADKHDLHGGQDAAERARLEMLAFECVDIHGAIARAVYSPDYDNLKDELENTTLTSKMTQLVTFLGDKKFFGGDQVKFPDFHLYEVLVTATRMFPKLGELFPTITDYIRRFEQLPRIAAYMASPKYIDSPYFGRQAKWGAWQWT